MDYPFQKISANSKETAKKWDDVKTDSSVDTRICPQCGAPRPVNTNLAVCAYCGYRLWISM